MQSGGGAARNDLDLGGGRGVVECQLEGGRRREQEREGEKARSWARHDDFSSILRRISWIGKPTTLAIDGERETWKPPFASLASGVATLLEESIR
jgi:hypothetical protein